MLHAIVSLEYQRVQTDGQTDGIAIASTALAIRALRRAVKTVSSKVVARSIAFRVVSIYWQGVAPFPLYLNTKGPTHIGRGALHTLRQP